MPSANNIAGQVIAGSFLHYPLMLHAFKGQSESARRKKLGYLYNRCVTAAGIYGGINITPDNLGAVIWLPGKNFTLTLPKEIRSGMALLPFELGIAPTLRLMNHDGESEGWIKKHAAPTMGYIWCIGVLPQARGKGYSRQLIDTSIAQMKRNGATECWLKTEDPKNVLIYQKLGFRLMNEMTVKSSGIQSWAMRRYM